MPQVPEDAHGEAVTPLRFFKQKGAVHGRATGCQNPSLGRFGGPQPSKMKSYRPALPGGEFAPRRKHFLSLWRKRPGQPDFFDTLWGGGYASPLFLKSKKARCMAAPFMIPWPAAGPAAGAPSHSCHPSACRLRPAGRFGARRRPCAAAGYTGCRSGPG